MDRQLHIVLSPAPVRLYFSFARLSAVFFLLLRKTFAMPIFSFFWCRKFSFVAYKLLSISLIVFLMFFFSSSDIFRRSPSLSMAVIDEFCNCFATSINCNLRCQDKSPWNILEIEGMFLLIVCILKFLCMIYLFPVFQYYKADH